MLIPHQQAVEVWPASGAAQRLDAPDVLEGGPEFPGLQLQLAEIWVGCGLIASPPAGCTHTVKADAQVEGYWSSDEIIPISSEGASEQLLGQLLSGVYVAVLANCPSAAGPEVEAAQQLVRSIRLRGGGLTLSASGFGVGGSQSESVAMPPGVRLYALFRGDLRGMLKALEDGITTLLGLTSAGANVSPVPIDKATCLEHLIQPGLPVHWYEGDTAGDQRAGGCGGLSLRGCRLWLWRRP
ncbi:hypothetical protein NZK33_15375 [Cyanobium sp. FGCU-6]|nr:hypothetical protein [Cyanobium sp. FGCU6]